MLFELLLQTLEAVDVVTQILQRTDVDPFPVPADVRDLVDGAIRSLFGVLILHNHLGDAAMAVAEAADSEPTSIRDHPQYPEVLKAWKTAHRVKRSILIRYQVRAPCRVPRVCMCACTWAPPSLHCPP